MKKLLKSLILCLMLIFSGVCFVACDTGDNGVDNHAVVFKNEDGTIISQIVYNKGDEIIVPENPIKQSDNIYKYVFKSWDNDVPEIVDKDLTFIAEYEQIYIDYVASFPNNVSISIDNVSLSNGDTLHYGDIIKIDCTIDGYSTESDFTISGVKQTNVVNFYSVIGNVKIVDKRQGVDFDLEFSDGVVIEKNGVELTQDDKLHFGDIVSIKYNETAAYEMTKFQVTGARKIDGDIYWVESNVNVLFEKARREFSITIPEEFKAFRGMHKEEEINEQTILYFNDYVIYQAVDSNEYGVENIKVSGVDNRYNNFSGYVTGNVTVDYDVYKKVAFRLDDGSTTKYYTKLGDSIKEAFDRNSISITDNNSIGIYDDWDYVNELEYDSLVNDGMYIYTKMATLDKLSFELSENKLYYTCTPADLNISGEVVFPRKRVNIDYNIEGFENCQKITSITLPIERAGSSFKNCIELTEVRFVGEYFQFTWAEDAEVDYFAKCTNLTTVYISYYKLSNILKAEDSFGGLIKNATTVYIAHGADKYKSAYLLENFTKKAQIYRGFEVWNRNAQ